MGLGGGVAKKVNLWGAGRCRLPPPQESEKKIPPAPKHLKRGVENGVRESKRRAE